MKMIIAKTEYIVENALGKRERAYLTFDLPYEEKSNRWVCETYESTEDYKYKIYGADSFHSLLLALEFARTRLKDITEKRKLKLYYPTCDNGTECSCQDEELEIDFLFNTHNQENISLPEKAND